MADKGFCLPADNNENYSPAFPVSTNISGVNRLFTASENISDADLIVLQG